MINTSLSESESQRLDLRFNFNIVMDKGEMQGPASPLLYGCSITRASGKWCTLLVHEFFELCIIFQMVSRSNLNYTHMISNLKLQTQEKIEEASLI